MSTLEKLKRFLEAETQTAITDERSDLIKSGVLDSFIMIRLINFIEEKLGIAVDMEKLSPDNFYSLEIITKTLDLWK